MPSPLEVASRHRTLEEVTAWVFSPGSTARLVRVLGQDEYTSDVVVAVRGASPAERFLIYDVT